MTFSGRRPSVEDDMWWKTTLDGRRPVVEDDLRWKMTFAGSLHAAYSALLHSFQRTMLDIRYQDAGSSVLNVLKPTSTAIENRIMVHILISNFQLAQKDIQGNILIIKSQTTSLTTFVVVVQQTKNSPLQEFFEPMISLVWSPSLPFRLSPSQN